MPYTWDAFLRSSCIIPLKNGGRAVLVGTWRGVYVSLAPSATATTWTRLGTAAEFPLVIVHQLTYYQENDILLAATLGRSAWRIESASSIVAALAWSACPVPMTLPNMLAYLYTPPQPGTGSPARAEQHESSLSMGTLVVAIIGGVLVMLLFVVGALMWRGRHAAGFTLIVDTSLEAPTNVVQMT